MKTKEIIVIKRDGSKEEYQEKKMKKVVIATGLEKDEAGRLVKSVTTWLKKHNRETVTSLEIRDRVLVELFKVNPVAAGKYDWYQKLKTKGKV